MNEIISAIIIMGAVGFLVWVFYQIGKLEGSKSKKIRFVDWNGKVHWKQVKNLNKELKKEMESEGE